MKLNTLLAILQQSEYNLDRFQVWVANHPHPDDAEPEKWTPKLRLIQHLVKMLFFLPIIWRFRLAVMLTQPGELAVRQATYARARQKLQELRQRGLTVVAIAGSYGKTSTKEILQHALNPQLPCVMTPKSINTMLGISQVILDDLKAEHKVFICELGEFNPGDLAELTQFITPDWAIMTPIGRQHVELLGSFEKIVAEFRDLTKIFNDRPDHLLIAAQSEALLGKNVLSYGLTDISEYRVVAPQVSRAGTEFEAIIPGRPQPLKVFIPLFGEHQASNTLPAFWLGEKLGVSLDQITKNLSSVPYIERRHQPIFAENNVLILDNSFNTNPDAIKESLRLLNQLNQGNRLIVTAGFVEQGAEAESAHLALGQLLAKTVDYVGLFSAKYATQVIEGFTMAGGDPTHILQSKTQEEVVKKLQPFIVAGSVLLFEGGYQEIHG